MKNLFKVDDFASKSSSDRKFFPTKKEAKAYRDDMNSKKKSPTFVVSRGPEHRHGESWAEQIHLERKK